MPIIDIQKPTKESIPRPTREALKKTAEGVSRYANEHAHELEKGTTTDKFYAACIRVATSNFLAMLKLQSAYLPECGAIFRNLVETTIDFFWVSSLLSTEQAKGERIAENFFLYAKSKFVETASTYTNIAKNDIFLRDIKTPFDDTMAIDSCKKDVAGRLFGDSWRNESTIFSNQDPIRWRQRSQVAADFVAKEVNLKGAPYLENLKNLSSYSHFDPAQISYFSDELQQRFFDRDINIAIGFVFDMVIYSYKRKGWSPPRNFLVLQHQFVWFST